MATQSPLKSVEARFWSKVDKSIGAGPSGDCWLWLARIDEWGYGGFSIGRASKKAHRVSYELTNGPIPEGALICHSCDNPACVNPAHLFTGSPKDNMVDKVAKGRHRNGWENRRLKTHCKRGHELIDENLRPNAASRQCRICHNERKRVGSKKDI